MALGRKRAWARGMGAMMCGVAVFAAATATYADMVLQEDFTDGLLNGYNAGASGSNWAVYGSGTALRAPVSRPFNYALSNRVGAYGTSFSDGAQWRLNQPGGSSTYWQIDKAKDVVVLKFQAYSDVARRSAVYYGPEVAMLEENPAFNPPPDYGHDLSFEVQQVFNTNAGDPRQLVPNVENYDPSPMPNAAKYAHYSGLTTTAALNGTYRNMVIWRNLPGTGTTNVETWGESLSGDYTVASEMNNKANPTASNAQFNLVQISLQRGSSASPPADEIYRAGTSLSTAQVGVMNLHLGVTRRTDFNLDYTNDIEDYFGWAAGYGNGGKTMITGDANNDGNTDRADLAELKSNWRVGTRGTNIIRYAYDTPVRQSSTALKAEVDLATGHVRLIGSAVAVLGYKLASEGGGLVADAGDNIWDATDGSTILATSSTGEDSDFGDSPTSITSWDLGAIYDRTADARDLTLTWQPDLGQVTRTGVVTYINSVPEPTSLAILAVGVLGLLTHRSRCGRR